MTAGAPVLSLDDPEGREGSDTGGQLPRAEVADVLSCASAAEHELGPGAMLSRQPATPLDLVYAGIGPGDSSPVDPRPPDRLQAALVEMGVRADSADALGWTWCPDSRALPGVRGIAKARPFAGVVGPRRAPAGPEGWFFIPVPPLAEGPPVLSPAPQNVLAVLPGTDLGELSQPLQLAGDPRVAARLWVDGNPVAWINGCNGWRGAKRRLLPDLGALGVGDVVVLHPDAAGWTDPKTFDGWQALADQLGAVGVDVRVSAAEGQVPAGTGLARRRRPESPQQRNDRGVRQQLLSASAERSEPAFAAALGRADHLFANPRAVFIGRDGLAAETCARGSQLPRARVPGTGRSLGL